MIAVPTPFAVLKNTGVTRPRQSCVHTPASHTSRLLSHRLSCTCEHNVNNDRRSLKGARLSPHVSKCAAYAWRAKGLHNDLEPNSELALFFPSLKTRVASSTQSRLAPLHVPPAQARERACTRCCVHGGRPAATHTIILMPLQCYRSHTTLAWCRSVRSEAACTAWEGSTQL